MKPEYFLSALRRTIVPTATCIIPVVGSSDGLEATLLSVLERRPSNCEVLVVLNAPYDDPYELAGEVEFLEAPSGASLVECVNLGIAAAKGPIVNILASGWEVDDGWMDAAIALFDDPLVAAVTPLVYQTADRLQLLAAGIGCERGGRKVVCRTLVEDGDSPTIGPMLQAAFYRRSALLAIDGLPTMVGDDFVDIDLALSLRESGWKTASARESRVFAPSIHEASHRGFSCGLRSERLFWRHWRRADRIGGLLAHSLIALADTMGQPLWQAPLRLLGRLAAICQFGDYRRQHQVLAALKAAADDAASQPAMAAAVDSPATMSSGDAFLRIDQAHSPRSDSGAKKSKHRRSRR
jgi:GT2 family glycosyltransferase